MPARVVPEKGFKGNYPFARNGLAFITVAGLNTLTSHRRAATAAAEHMRSLAAGAFAVAFRPGAMRHVQAPAKSASACL